MTAARVPRTVLAAVFGVAVLAPGVAFAQNAVEASDASVDEPRRAEARDLFQRGVTSMDQGRFAEALELFRAAYARWENPKILVNIATALVALERPAEAAAHYVLYMKTGSLSAERSAEVDATLARLKPRVARLVVEPSGDVQRAELNGREAELGPSHVHWLPPGRHVLVLHYRDGQRVSRELDIEAGSLVELDGASLKPTKTATDAPVVATGPSLRDPVSSTAASTAGDRMAPAAGSTEDTGWALVVRADIDGAGRGGVGAAGITVPLLRPLRASAGVLIGARGGAWLGLDASACLGNWRPTIGASLPTFFGSGAYPGLGGELGLRYEAEWYVSPFARVAVVHFIHRPAGFLATVLVPSIGVEVPL
jgi:hypothetical protein